MRLKQCLEPFVFWALWQMALNIFKNCITINFHISFLPLESALSDQDRPTSQAPVLFLKAEQLQEPGLCRRLLLTGR
jgi:hypothetical protein